MADMATPEIKNIDELLRNYIGKDAKVLNYTTKFLTAPGDNYGSVMLSADITVQQNGDVRKIHAVAKMIPPSEFMRTIFHIQETTPKELSVYKDLAPALINFQKEKGIPDDKLLDVFATFYGGRLNLNNTDLVDEDSVIVLENLKVLGYTTGDRLLSFTLGEAKDIIEHLARFHAVPIALKILNPEKFQKEVLPSLKPCYFGDDSMDADVELYADELRKHLGKSKDIGQYLENVIEHLRAASRFRQNFVEPVEPFASIVHNDFWVNNMMVLRNKKQITNVKIVDYQVSLYGSPVRDLVFFLFTSVDDGALENNLDDILRFYYDRFIECLKEFDLDVTPFSFEAYNRELQREAQHEFGHILMLSKPIMHDKEKLKTVDLTQAGSFTLDIVVPRFFTKFTFTVLEFLRRGWIKLD